MTRDIAWLTAILVLISPASAASIKAGDDAIVISGKIESGDAATFFTIANAASARVVVLESDGGHLDPAVTIGRDIRRRGLATVVRTNAKCVSACVLIWLAGSPGPPPRGRGAKVGVSARPQHRLAPSFSAALRVWGSESMDGTQDHCCMLMDHEARTIARIGNLGSGAKLCGGRRAHLPSW